MRISVGESVLLELFCMRVTPETTKPVDFNVCMFVFFSALRVLSGFLVMQVVCASQTQMKVDVRFQIPLGEASSLSPSANE